MDLHFFVEGILYIKFLKLQELYLNPVCTNRVVSTLIF